MLSPLLPPATQAPARNPAGQHASANDDSQGDDFAQNFAQNFAQKLDHASAQPPKAPDARPRDKLRGPVRGTAGSAGTAGNEPAKAQPVPLPAPSDGKEAKNERTLPPDPEGDRKDPAAEPPTPQGVAALLAELRAAAPAATAAAGAALSASDNADAVPGRSRRADASSLLPGGAARGGAEANTAIGEAASASLLGHSAAARARREGTGADVSADVSAHVSTHVSADGSLEGNPQGGPADLRDRFAQQLSAASAQDGSALRADGMPTASNPLATAAAFGSSPTPTATAAEAQLPATPGSAQFGAQLGAQISTFVRDGIEHARLHLNPAEMGPVSVQIHLDGQTAMVHLSAENAHTRQALEQALPLLAGSLREAGLTLSGGGVFEQARQGGGAQTGNDADRNAGNGSARDRGDDDQRTAGSAIPARRRGVVDLVA